MKLETPESNSGDGERHECPWDGCGREDFATEAGMKQHHTVAHGVSIAGVRFTCDNCGSVGRKKKNVIEGLDRHFCDLECRAEWMSDNWTGGDNPNHVQKSEVVCAHCGVEKDVVPAAADRHERHFCDPQCHGEWMSENKKGESALAWSGGPQTVQCANCGSVKQTRKSRTQWYKRHFCDPQCHGEWKSENWQGSGSPHYNRVAISCANCGGRKEILPHIASQSQRNFCGRDCYDEWLKTHYLGESNPEWKGGDFAYGAGWNESTKEKVRERDGRRCQGCGVAEAEHVEQFGRKLSVHHITPARSIDAPEGRNDGSNLVSFCVHCHKQWEGIPLRPVAVSSGVERRQR